MLISLIMQISDESVIDQVDELIGMNPNQRNNDILRQLNKPIKKKLNLDEVKRDQNFQEIDKDEFKKLIREADIREPLEELLQMV